MSTLKEKLAALKAKQVTVTKPTKSAPQVIKRNEEKAVAKDLGSLLVRVGNMNEKVAKHLESQEAKGLYNLGSEADNLEGFDKDLFLRHLRDLDAATVEKSPDIRQFSRAIRKNLEQYEELTHILSDEQLGIITSGILTLANVSTEPKSAAAKTKRTKTKIEDLGNKSMEDLFGGL